MTVSWKITKLFLDSRKITRAADRAKWGGLTKAGGYLRKVARNLLKKASGAQDTSSPGSPPKIHTDGVGLKTILYGVDKQAESVATGPVKLNQRSAGLSGSTTVPQLMEFGGSGRVSERQAKDGSWRRISPKAARNAPKRMRNARYSPRPFMEPALAKSQNAMPEQFRNLFGGV